MVSDTNKISLSTSIGNGKLQLPTCIYNASGPRSGTSTALSRICLSKGAGAVLSKSATLVKQKGNPQPRTYHMVEDVDGGEFASFNSEGLPNSGIDYYVAKDTISEIYEDAGANNDKPYIVSVSGKTIDDNLEMIVKIYKSLFEEKQTRIRGIELNVACPNIIGKPIIGYDFEQLRDVVLQKVEKCIETLEQTYADQDHSLFPALGLKLPPYFDFSHYELVANILNQYDHIVSYVATINTVGNTLPIDSVGEIPTISSNNGYCGLSGPAVKYIALANVKKLRQLLKPSIDVVGVGGITCGKDAFEMLLCGAAAVQIGTCHWKEGPACFDRIQQELVQLMKEKNYSSLDQFKGKLQPWSKEQANQSRMMRIQKGKPKTAGSKGEPVESNSYLVPVLFIIIAVLLGDKLGVIPI